jgi:hypothetical protein
MKKPSSGNGEICSLSESLAYRQWNPEQKEENGGVFMNVDRTKRI